MRWFRSRRVQVDCLLALYDPALWEREEREWERAQYEAWRRGGPDFVRWEAPSVQSDSEQ